MTLHTRNGGHKVRGDDSVRLPAPPLEATPGRIERLWLAIARHVHFPLRTT